MLNRTLIPLLLWATVAAAQAMPPASTDGPPASAGDEDRSATPDMPVGAEMDGPDLVSAASTRQYPLMNVEIVDARGTQTSLVAFHRISGENVFRGFLGAADIDVPYDRVADFKIAAPADPGGRMRADFTLSSGKQVAATFDEREGEQLFAGYAVFGRVTIYWRDLRTVKFTGRTRTSDLPKYGVATEGVDVRLTDRDGVDTELVAFRRATAENYIQGLRGATRVEVPLRILRSVKFGREDASPLLVGEMQLRDRDPLVLRFPRYAEDPVYRGRAEFGDLRIRLGEIRELVVHRSTPKLRDLDPIAAAEGREVEIGDSNPR